jgi:hypothetical protein
MELFCQWVRASGVSKVSPKQTSISMLMSVVVTMPGARTAHSDQVICNSENTGL